MPGVKCTERIRAREIYLEHNGDIKLVDIAEIVGVEPSKIRKWKSLDKWDDDLTNRPAYFKKKQVERSTSKGNAPQVERSTKKGAPKGNKNAVGNKSPTQLKQGNTNAQTHGAYAVLRYDTLDEEEKLLKDSMPDEEETLLIEMIRSYEVRERRFMIAIKKYREMSGGLAINGVLTSNTKRDFDTPEERELYENKRYDLIEQAKVDELGYNKFTQTTTEATIDVIKRLEDGLTRIQASKMRCIAALNNIRKSKREEEERQAKSNNTGLLSEFLRVIEEVE